MASNHRVNQAEWETAKGVRYVNGTDTMHDVAKREYKATKRMQEFQTIEEISTFKKIVLKPFRVRLRLTLIDSVLW
jgi:hypothetical protein